MKTLILVWTLLILLNVAFAFAYYGNPYVDESQAKSVERSLSTQGGFKHVLGKREGLARQIFRGYTRKTVQGASPYSFSQFPTVTKAIKKREYYQIQNDHNRYRTPITYAEEKVKDKLAKALGIHAVFDPAAHKNVLIYKIPTRKFIELLNDPRSRTETFRGSDVDVDAVMESLGLGKGVFVPRNRDDNIKY